MQIILLEQVKKLGNTGDVVSVKNGYARNYLIPNKKAMRATKDNIAYFEVKKKEIEAADKAKTSDAEKASKKIDGNIITLIQQAGEDGRLYGSVNANDIAKALSEKSSESINRKQVVLHAPIKYMGVYTVEVDLYGTIIANVHVNIARSEGEAKDAETRFKRGEEVMEGPSGEKEQVQEKAAEEVAAAEAA